MLWFWVAVFCDERLWRQQHDYFIFNLFLSLLWPLGRMYLLHLLKNECTNDLALSKILNIINFYYNISHICNTWVNNTLLLLVLENTRNYITWHTQYFIWKTCFHRFKINSSKVCQANFVSDNNWNHAEWLAKFDKIFQTKKVQTLSYNISQYILHQFL